jgi:putative ABC transport system substrate-binding protein
VPIVFLSSFDPVKLGMVASLNQPGGNATGISNLSGELESKQLQLARELAPNADVIAQLVNPNNRNSQNDTKALQETAQAIGQRLVLINVSNEHEIEPAFVELIRQRVGAFIVPPDVLFTRKRDQLVALAAHHAIPAIYTRRDFARAGGLMSYGTDLIDSYRLTGVYTGRVLKGEKPASLPIIQSAKIELAINLKTAKTLGLEIPQSILLRADEVIE